MRQRMQAWAGHPSGGEVAGAVGMALAVVVIAVLVLGNRGTGELGLAQFLGFGLGAAVLVVLLVRVITALRSRRGTP